MNQKHVWEKSQVCDDFLKKKKKKKKLRYPNSEIQLYSALISSIQYFELNLAAEPYLLWETNPIFTMLDDAILLTYVLVYKQ